MRLSIINVAGQVVLVSFLAARGQVEVNSMFLVGRSTGDVLRKMTFVARELGL